MCIWRILVSCRYDGLCNVLRFKFNYVIVEILISWTSESRPHVRAPWQLNWYLYAQVWRLRSSTVYRKVERTRNFSKFRKPIRYLHHKWRPLLLLLRSVSHTQNHQLKCKEGSRCNHALALSWWLFFPFYPSIFRHTAFKLDQMGAHVVVCVEILCTHSENHLLITL